MGHLWSWFRGIKGKLLLAAAFSLVGFASLGFVSMWGTNEILAQLRSSHKDIIPNLQNLAEMRRARAVFAMQSYATISTFRESKPIDESLKAVAEAIEHYQAALASYEKATFMPEEEKGYNETKESFTKLIAEMKDIHGKLSKKDVPSMESAYLSLTTTYVQLGLKTGGFTKSSIDLYNKRAQYEGEVAAQTESSVKMWLTTIIFLAGGFSLLSLIWIAHSLSKSISGIAARLSTSSATVTSSVEQLNEAGNSLSQSSTEAAASLEETVASLEELSSMVKMNSDNAKQAASLSATSREAAEKGQQEINSLISAMTTISSSSKKIEEIISVIDDIAFQTNLLALNASVEAARAGEQGKGFAVVAEAVRALAQRSAAAAKDITGLIKESVSEVEHGSRIASQSGVVLNNIVTSVKKVSDLNNEIASASSEQTSGIQQISKAMNQLDQASQSNAASAEEISATSGEISTLAVTTQNLTDELTLVVHGAGASVSPSLEHHHDKEVKTKSKPKVFAKSTGLATAKPVAKVIPMVKKSAAPKNEAADMIPFDDEEPRAKVGTTDGF